VQKTTRKICPTTKKSQWKKTEEEGGFSPFFFLVDA